METKINFQFIKASKFMAVTSILVAFGMYSNLSLAQNPGSDLARPKAEAGREKNPRPDIVEKIQVRRTVRTIKAKDQPQPLSSDWKIIDDGGFISGGANLGSGNQIVDKLEDKGTEILNLLEDDILKNEFEELIKRVQIEVPEFRDFILQGVYSKPWKLEPKPFVDKSCINPLTVDVSDRKNTNKSQVKVVACQDSRDVRISTSFWRNPNRELRNVKAQVLMHELLLFHGIEMMNVDDKGRSIWRGNWNNFFQGSVKMSFTEIQKAVRDINRIVMSFQRGDGFHLIDELRKSNIAILGDDLLAEALEEITTQQLDRACQPELSKQDQNILSFAYGEYSVYMAPGSGGWHSSKASTFCNEVNMGNDTVANTIPTFKKLCLSLLVSRINSEKHPEIGSQVITRYSQWAQLLELVYFFEANKEIKMISLSQQDAQKIQENACRDLKVFKAQTLDQKQYFYFPNLSKWLQNEFRRGKNKIAKPQ